MADKITWGVEFEFALPDLTPSEADSQADSAPDQAALRSLALLLHEQLDLPVAAICQCEDD